MPEIATQTQISMRTNIQIHPVMEEILMNSIVKYQTTATNFMEIVAEPYFLFKDNSSDQPYHLYAANSMNPRQWKWHYLIYDREGNLKWIETSRVSKELQCSLAAQLQEQAIVVQ